MSPAIDSNRRAQLAAAVDEARLVATARSVVDLSSPTGSEQQVAECMRDTLEGIGLAVSWQEVEDGRPNVVGRLEGSGGAPSLMFNGHMDTSYSGREAHLRAKPGFQPHAEVRDGHIWGLGISNMKGALACYVEALRAIADMCSLGEPAEQRVVLGHYGTMWARISTQGPRNHTAFSSGRLGENAIVRMARVLDDVLAWIPEWERHSAYRGIDGVVNIGAIGAGAPWRGRRTPHQ